VDLTLQFGGAMSIRAASRAAILATALSSTLLGCLADKGAEDDALGDAGPNSRSFCRIDLPSASHERHNVVDREHVVKRLRGREHQLSGYLYALGDLLRRVVSRRSRRGQGRRGGQQILQGCLSSRVIRERQERFEHVNSPFVASRLRKQAFLDGLLARDDCFDPRPELG
jgi:hypothetical protein